MRLTLKEFEDLQTFDDNKYLVEVNCIADKESVRHIATQRGIVDKVSVVVMFEPLNGLTRCRKTWKYKDILKP